MKQKPLVSIVIPCYNYGHYLDQAITSALNQTYPNTEIVVINDGSTDNTEKIAQSYKTVRLVTQPNQGPSSARNRGAKEAKGEFVVFLDADDTIEPDYIQDCLELLLQQPENVGYVYTQMRLFGREEGITDYPEFSPATLKLGNYVNASALVKRELVKEHPYNTQMRGWEDWDFYLTLAEQGVYGKLLNKPLLNYRQHEDDSGVNTDYRTRPEAHISKLIARHRRFYTAKDRLALAIRYPRTPLLVPIRAAIGLLRRLIRKLGVKHA